MSTTAIHQGTAPKTQTRLRDQPKAVWAVGFACVVSFMGIGLVDPILPVIADQLHATAGQVSMLFTSYMLITGLAMFFTGWVSSRIGAKRTLLVGLVIIVAFAAACSMSNSVNQIIGLRAGWGLGNALFIATALATIVGAAAGGVSKAIMVYEAAMGLGMAIGPLVGGLLGEVTWRAPFFGTAVLMAVGFVAVITLLPGVEKPVRKVAIGDSFKALRHSGLRSLAITAFLYNMGFFVMLSQSPFALELGALGIGFVFFGWGVALAITSVGLAPVVHKRWGRLWPLRIAMAVLALTLAVEAFAPNRPVLIAAIVIGGGCLGLCNTLLTESAMEVSHLDRPIASASYSAVRFTGGAIATYIAGQITEHIGLSWAFYFGAVMVLCAIAVMSLSFKHLRHIDREAVEHGELSELEEAEALTAGA